MERRMRGNSHVRCGVGEKMEITSKSYLSPSLGGTHGQATDMQIHVNHIMRTKETLNRLLAENTGKPYDQICKDTERDNFMSANEALAYGLIDKVLVRK